jgi:hypothetical protein
MECRSDRTYVGYDKIEIEATELGPFDVDELVSYVYSLMQQDTTVRMHGSQLPGPLSTEA